MIFLNLIKLIPNNIKLIVILLYTILFFIMRIKLMKKIAETRQNFSRKERIVYRISSVLKTVLVVVLITLIYMSLYLSFWKDKEIICLLYVIMSNILLAFFIIKNECRIYKKIYLGILSYLFPVATYFIVYRRNTPRNKKKKIATTALFLALILTSQCIVPNADIKKCGHNFTFLMNGVRYCRECYEITDDTCPYRAGIYFVNGDSYCRNCGEKKEGKCHHNLTETKEDGYNHCTYCNRITEVKDCNHEYERYEENGVEYCSNCSQLMNKSSRCYHEDWVEVKENMYECSECAMYMADVDPLEIPMDKLKMPNNLIVEKVTIHKMNGEEYTIDYLNEGKITKAAEEEESNSSIDGSYKAYEKDSTNNFGVKMFEMLFKIVCPFVGVIIDVLDSGRCAIIETKYELNNDSGLGDSIINGLKKGTEHFKNAMDLKKSINSLNI